MPEVQSVRFRVAGAADATAIAALHADSWRRHYRGVYSDSFLDGDVGDDRLRIWSERLAVATSETAHTVVAEDDDGLVGFTHVVFDADPEWGALLDNLHVRYASKRQGVGSELIARSVEFVGGCLQSARFGARRSKPGNTIPKLSLSAGSSRLRHVGGTEGES
jgi:predicted N-acetyltransferase YhbS